MHRFHKQCFWLAVCIKGTASAVACSTRGCSVTQNTCRQSNVGSYTVFEGKERGVKVHAWVNGVEVERPALEQILQLSQMSEVIHHPIVVMPDVHTSQGTTVGTVIPTTRAIIPASVGVDIGCGIIAVRTSLSEEDLPSSLAALRLAIEVAVPHGRTHNGRSGLDAGSWRKNVPESICALWRLQLQRGFEEICSAQKVVENSNHIEHLGTLGGGNHFIELCVDEGGYAGVCNRCAHSECLHNKKTTPENSGRGSRQRNIWVMLHSGSRGVGNRIGTVYCELARQDMKQHVANLPNSDVAYLREGSTHFDEYVKAVSWAQCYAKLNREIMLSNVLHAMRNAIGRSFIVDPQVIDCHHNYVERVELNPGECVWLTRKGATSARTGELAIIPGSMGSESYVVRGKGNRKSYSSCSHGAGRRYGRGEARRRFTLEQHKTATVGIECRKDSNVLDETPMAYKDIGDVIHAQEDLVEVVYVLKQILCVKG